jgi:hypothetical protein
VSGRYQKNGREGVLILNAQAHTPAPTTTPTSTPTHSQLVTHTHNTRHTRGNAGQCATNVDVGFIVSGSNAVSVEVLLLT